MAPLAIYLAEAGIHVTGQDDNLQPAVRRILESKSIEIVDVDTLPDGYSLVGYSSAIAAHHPLYESAQAKGLTLLRRGELLAQVVQSKKLVAIVGSHGKTTTTGFLVQMLRKLNFDFSYVMGGLFKDDGLSPAAFSAESDWVVAEIDESDGTIEHFAPEVTLAVNFDWDHADRYPSRRALLDTFGALFNKTSNQVFVPTNFSEAINFNAQLFHASEDDFNLHNWNGAKAVCIELTDEEPPMSLDDMSGIKRRQDVLLQEDALTVIADYAHHPTEINALLKWCRQHFEGELIAVFQPHRYTRTQQFANEFATVLCAADKVYLLPVYAACESPNEAGKTDQIVLNGHPDWALIDEAGLLKNLPTHVGADRKQTVVFIGAGDIDRMAAQFVEDLHWMQGVAEHLAEESRPVLQEPLARKTTLRVGGNARYYAEPLHAQDLSTLLKYAVQQETAVFMLGRGSNLIVLESGFDGLVIRLNHPNWRSIESLGDQRMRVGAGVRLKELCGQAAKFGLAGLEFLEGIPGSLGGALRMNAGAMGGWIFDVVESVEFVTMDGELHERPLDYFHVGYRHCKELMDAVATSAVLRSATASDADSIRMTMDTYASTRKESQPREPSAGCIFKNPEGNHAGKLIDESNLKGTRVGNAEVSTVHGNFIVNLGGATSDDVIEVIRTVRREVKRAQGIELEPEVLLVGDKWEAIL